MKTWTISTQYKKSVIQCETWAKDGQTISRDLWYRSGSFIIETEGKNPPDFDLENENGLDIFTVPRIREYAAGDITTEQLEWPSDMPEKERESLEKRFEKEDFDDVMESLEGWTQVTCEIRRFTKN
jgi:hypothetical protein